MEERRGEERVKVSVRSREVRVGLTGVRRWRVLVTWGPCSPYSERRRFHEWRGGIDVAACLPACLDHLQCLRPGYLVCSRGHTAHRCALTEPPWESSSYFQCWRSLTSGCGPGRTGVTGPANRVAACWAARPPHWPPPLPTTGRGPLPAGSPSSRRRKFIGRNLDWITPQQRPRPCALSLQRPYTSVVSPSAFRPSPSNLACFLSSAFLAPPSLSSSHDRPSVIFFPDRFIPPAYLSSSLLPYTRICMRVYVCIDVYFIFDLGPSRDLYMSNRFNWSMYVHGCNKIWKDQGWKDAQVKFSLF